MEEISDGVLLEEVEEAMEEVELLDDMPVSNVQLFPKWSEIEENQEIKLDYTILNFIKKKVKNNPGRKTFLRKLNMVSIKTLETLKLTYIELTWDLRDLGTQIIALPSREQVTMLSWQNLRNITIWGIGDKYI